MYFFVWRHTQTQSITFRYVFGLKGKNTTPRVNPGFVHTDKPDPDPSANTPGSGSATLLQQILYPAIFATNPQLCRRGEEEIFSINGQILEIHAKCTENRKLRRDQGDALFPKGPGGEIIL